MSPRPYRLGKRKEAVDETRDRILAAAQEILKGDGYMEFTVDTVAGEADVSRATVYYQFGSKAGLLEALFDDLAVRAYATISFKRASYDRLIAAHALSLGVAIVTNNEYDFADVPGLKVENWAA